MGKKAVSGKILDDFGIIHQRDFERCYAVAEDVGIVVRADLESEPVPIHIDMDRFARRMDHSDG